MSYVRFEFTIALRTRHFLCLDNNNGCRTDWGAQNS